MENLSYSAFFPLSPDPIRDEGAARGVGFQVKETDGQAPETEFQLVRRPADGSYPAPR
jgi:hypothetical protein